MNSQDRRAAIDAYKEQKIAAGVIAVHCQTDGQVWVAKAANLDTIENRIRFTLRLGSHPNSGMQKAYSEHGDDAFSIEILEQLHDDIPDIARPRILKERVAHWRVSLNAQAL